MIDRLAELENRSHLHTGHLDADLRGRSVRGGAVTVVTQAVRFLVNLGSLCVLARLLTRADFGLIFAVTAITNLVATFRDLGLSTATLQRSEITHRQVSVLFWINLGMSVVVTLVIAALAPVIVWVYHGDTRLTPVVLTYAGLSVFGGLSGQHQALLRRQMRFSALAVVEIVSLVVSRGVAVTSAWYGAGYWALVIQAGVEASLQAAGYWLACSWRPSLPGRAEGLGPMLRFGRNLASGRVVRDVAGNIDKILLGRFAGEAVTGAYGNAFRLLLLPIQNIIRPLGTVAVPALSRLQEQPDRFRTYYQNAILLLTTAVMPAMLFVFVTAEQVVLAVLGPQWVEATLILRILLPAALTISTTPATAWVYISLGRTDRQIRWTMLVSPIRVIAVLIGIFWGAIGVAVATSVVMCSLRLPGIIHCFRGTPLRLRHLTQVIWRPALASCGAAAVLLGVNQLGWLAEPAVLSLLVDLAIFVTAYLWFWMLLPGGRSAARGLARLTRELNPAGRRSVSSVRAHSNPATVETQIEPCHKQPFVSVIIPVYDDHGRLTSCLRALQNQSYPRERFEVIVVDNGSCDESIFVIARSFGVRVVREPVPGSYAARNKGLSMATGEVIAFTDADCVPQPEWLERGVTCLGRELSCGLAAGAIRFVFQSPNRLTACELYESIFDLDQERFLARSRFACTANVFTYSGVVRDVGPFDARLKSVGDRDWCNRVAAAGYTLAFAEDAVVHHPARGTLKELLRKRLRVAGGHHDLARKKGLPALRFVNALRQQLIRNPIWGAARIWRKAGDVGLRMKLKTLGLHAFLCYAEAGERIRLQAGGVSRR